MQLLTPDQEIYLDPSAVTLVQLEREEVRIWIGDQLALCARRDGAGSERFPALAELARAVLQARGVRALQS